MHRGFASDAAHTIFKPRRLERPGRSLEDNESNRFFTQKANFALKSCLREWIKEIPKNLVCNTLNSKFSRGFLGDKIFLIQTLIICIKTDFNDLV